MKVDYFITVLSEITCAANSVLRPSGTKRDKSRIMVTSAEIVFSEI